MEEFTIIVPTTFDEQHYQGVVCLLAQLTTRCITLTPEMYHTLVEAPSSDLCLLVDNQAQVVGMLTLNTCMSPTGKRGWIEDVVVDEAYRGKALGRKLVDYAIGLARERGIQVLMLTSKPKRVAANALYRSVGFEPKETNVYKMQL